MVTTVMKKWILAALVLIIVAPFSGHADDGDLLWDNGLEVEYPEILLPDGNGGAIVVWATKNYPLQIRAQRYDPNGLPLWGPTGKRVSDAPSATYPAATEDLFGGCVVTYASGGDLLAQRLDSQGDKLWNHGNGTKVLSGVSPSEAPIITPDGAGGAYIGYRRMLNQVSKNGAVGDTSGYEFVMPGVERFSMVYDGQRYIGGLFPHLEWRPGGVFLAWFSSSTLNIHAQHVSGVPQWGDTVTMRGVLVSTEYTHTSITHQRSCRLVPDDNGGLIVAWAGWEGSPLDSGQIRAQRLDASGSPQWSDDGVVLLDTDVIGGDSLSWWKGLSPPELVTDGAGGAILVWTDMRNTHNYPGDTDIYCQRVDSEGGLLWGDSGLWVTWAGDTTGETPLNSGTESNPTIVSDGSGGAIIAVQDLYKSQNIFTNRVGSDGVTLWTQWPVWDDGDSAYANQTNPQIIFDPYGPAPQGAIVAWQGKSGAAKLEVNNAPPGNDNYADAYALPLCGSTPCPVVGSIYWATSDGDTSCAPNPDQPDVWYRYTALEDGLIEINTCGSYDMLGAGTGPDTVLSLHSDMPNADSNELACNDDASDGECLGTATYDSALSHFMAAGETAYLRVSRYSSFSNGRYKLAWRFSPLP